MRLGLKGWVRNEEDGSVAALIAGPDGAIAAMIERLRRGPTGALVSDVETEAVRLERMPADFGITG
ncbi:acylphosphatase [Rhizobium sp. Pop5]|nr:acylphosphatase [Rhizobium sp. Pop5]